MNAGFSGFMNESILAIDNILKCCGEVSQTAKEKFDKHGILINKVLVEQEKRIVKNSLYNLSAIQEGSDKAVSSS